MESLPFRDLIAARPLWVDVSHPWALLGLLLIVPAVWLSWTSRSGGPRWRDLTSGALRVMAIIALVAALADTRVVRRSDKLCVTILLDESRSINPSDQTRAIEAIKRNLRDAGASDRFAVIGFAGQSVLQMLPTTGGAIPKMQGEFLRGFTDIGQAVRLALSIAPQDAAHRIVLVSDGNDTVADPTALAAAAAARQAGTPIDTCTIGSAVKGDLWVERLLMDSRKNVKQPFTIKAVVHSDVERDAKITMTRRGRFVDLQGEGKRFYRIIHLKKGPNLVTVGERPEQLDSGGMYDYTVRVEADGDPEHSNNRATGIVHVLGPPRVLIVDDSPDGAQGRHLLAALTGAGIETTLTDPDGYPTKLTEMNHHSCLVLSDVSAYKLTESQRKLTRQWVESGGGFIWVGGEKSFGPGGYADTAIEKVSPVSCDVKRYIERASLALVILVDMSGSMGMPVTNKMTKMDLANEGAVKAIEELNKGDHAGVIMVDTAAKSVTHPTLQQMSADRKSRLVDAVRSARPGGGGIFCRTALDAGLDALAGVKATSKHIILFGDAEDCEQQGGCEMLVSQAHRDGITVSTIGLGRPTDEHGEFLQRVAAAGGGHSYFTDDPNQLPRIFLQDVSIIARRAFIEPDEGIVPAVVGRTGIDPILRGLGPAPRLRGQVAATLKPRATLLMYGPEPDDPLLAKWRFGLGKAVAWTSDARGRWATEWVAWDGFGKFWSQAARWAIRNENIDSPVTADAVIRGQRGVIVADAIDDEGRPITDKVLKGFVHGDDQGAAREVELRQVSPGRYEGRFVANRPGAYYVTVADGNNGNQILDVVGAVASTSQEFLRLSPNRALMSQLSAATDGRTLLLPASATALMQPSVGPASAALEPANLFLRPDEPVYTYKPVAHALLAVAMFLFFSDIVVRRFALPERVVRWLTPARRREGDQAVLGRLRDRQAALRREAPAPVAVGKAAGPPPLPEIAVADDSGPPAAESLPPAGAPSAPRPSTPSGAPASAGSMADRLRAAKRRAQAEMIEKSQRDR